MQRVEKRRACKERGYSFNTKCKGSRHMKDSSNAVNTRRRARTLLLQTENTVHFFRLERFY
jgi:hypothetical protein